MDCIFCKIVNGELKSFQVYEDEHTLAFLDISPVNYGHTLVIPKKHFENLEAITEEELSLLANTVKKVGLAIIKGLGVEGYNVQVNNGSVAGQIIPHLHFHITPRTEGDSLELWTHGKYADGESAEAMEKIKKEL
jgi:histidine triad (HIT) family protein